MAQFDIVIIGSGPGGYVAALRAAQLGARVAVVEDNHVGGTCLNWGCIPTKALIRSGRVAALVRNAKELGVTVGDVSIDYAAMAARKDKVVKLLRDGIEHLFKLRKIELVRGKGALASPTAVSVRLADGGERTLEGAKVIVASGSEPAKPKAFPFDGDRVVTSEDAVVKTSLPKSVVVVGGGFIGCEYASLYANLGCEVTIVELLDDILATMDETIIKEVTRGLKKHKIKVKTGIKVDSMARSSEAIVSMLSNGEALTTDMALISIGRRPVSEGLGLDKVGVAVDKGFVGIDDHCRTNVESIYAIGDVTGKIQLAHVASEQGIVAVEHIMGRDAKMDYSVVPACVFTDPEVATVGITEKQARESGAEYKTGQFLFRALGKAHAEGEIEGLVKVIAQKADGRILGVHMIGHGASDLISEAAVAMKNGVSVEGIIRTIHAHPTLPEAFKEAAEALEGRAIHQQ
jgi:dihydrolipoamide dehydrogenase